MEDIRDNWDQICSEEGYAVPIGAEGERDLFSAAFARAEQEPSALPSADF